MMAIVGFMDLNVHRINLVQYIVIK